MVKLLLVLLLWMPTQWLPTSVCLGVNRADSNAFPISVWPQLRKVEDMSGLIVAVPRSGVLMAYINIRGKWHKLSDYSI
jgi:hypothetical protein